MTCREFSKTIEALTLADLSSIGDQEVLAHQSGCASCAGLLQERTALAGAMQILRSRTAAAEAPAVVEQNVLRAFRQSSALPSASASGDVRAFRWSDLFGWRAYATAAVVAAICLGLGLWFAQHSRNTAQQATAKTGQPAPPSATQAEGPSQSPVQASQSSSNRLSSETDGVRPQRALVTTASLAQSEQAQGYTPLMLCDPISCSGDAQVVRMELPATAADGSTGSQMADVIVGDDGLVRAIRIVQQQ
jgi:hypothetical protein